MHTLRVFDVATGAALAWFPGRTLQSLFSFQLNWQLICP